MLCFAKLLLHGKDGEMNIVVNGESKEIDDATTVAVLIERFGYDNAIGAVAVNMTFVPSDAYENTVLKKGDEVEILAPVCGG